MNNNKLMRMIFLTGILLIFCVGCQKKVDNRDQVLVNKVVNEILKARSRNTLIQPISKTHGELSLVSAYAVQLRLSHELSKSYGPIAGYKLGYADASSLKKNHTSIPAYGPIFKSQIKKSEDVISAGHFQNFSIEQEIVFTIAKNINQTVISLDELVSDVKSVHIGFDMPENIFDGPTNVIDFVASGGGSKYFVLSEGLDPVKTDVTNVNLSVLHNDSVIYRGSSNNVLGNPWFALRAVAIDLAKRGRPLKAGDVIFSGKVASTYTIESDKAQGIYKGIASPFTDIQVTVK